MGGARHPPLRPDRHRARVQRGHAAAVRLGVAPARRPRDELLAARLRRPLPPDARRADLLPDGLRRQRPADRALRRAEARHQRRRHCRGPSSSALCLAETRTTAARYEDLWRRLGLSVDWSLLYSTIDERCQRTAQTSLRPAPRGRPRARAAATRSSGAPSAAPRSRRPTSRTSERKGRIHDVTFRAPTGHRSSSPPPARSCCPAAWRSYFHPGDERYRDLVGSTARVPVFGHEVPIRADESVDPAFGTGLMMVCTFGDAEDVAKWRRDQLDLRLVIEPDGRLNELAGPLAGQAGPGRAQRRRRAPAGGGRAGGEHARCGRSSACTSGASRRSSSRSGRSGSSRVQEHRDRFRARADELTWIPPFMKRRLEDWIDGLKWDWNISRQRHYGVPFPVWYCAACSGAVVAPLRPAAGRSAGDARRPTCPHCGGAELQPERDVMDTWMTSSLSPQVNDGWAANGRYVGSGAGADEPARAGVRDHPDLAVLLGRPVGVPVRPASRGPPS